MPYSLRGRCVVDTSGQTVPGGCHGSRTAARRHLRALYANVPDATMKAGNYGARAGQVITGNLVRGSDGKFTSGGKPSAAKPVARGVQLSKPTPKKPLEAPKAPKRTRGSRGGKRTRIAKPKKTDEQKRQERDDQKLRERQANRDAVKQRMAANDTGLSPSGFDKLMDFAAGNPPADAEGLIRMGLAERAGDGSVRMTASGRATVNAANRGDYQAAIDAISKGTDQEAGRRARAEQRAARQAERERRRADREAKRRGGSESSSTPLSSGALQWVVGGKSFSVFKDASGRYRWLTVTTTAFEDRDEEVISTKAIAADVARADADGQYGPLRWWHVGQPNPLDQAAPWGPGIDLGWCDFNATSDSGLSLIESGTFKDEPTALTIAAKADQYEVSPGFFHPIGQPGPDGAYHSIRRFERSLVPRWAGRASNLFTALAVQETSMDDRKRAALKEAGFSDQQIAGFLSAVETKEQSGQQQGIAFKSATIYYGPGNEPGIIQDGAWVALKAAAPDAVPAPAAEEKAPEPMEGEPSDDMGGSLFSPEELQEITAAVAPAVAAAVVEQLSPMLNMETKMGKLLDEFKGMYATKEAGLAAEIAQIKAALGQVPALEARLKELEGDQPLVTAPAEIEAALKSAGPQAPPDLTAPQVPNDPARPMAGIAVALMPELYTEWPAPQAPPAPAPQQPTQPATWNGWPTAGGS